MKRPRRIIILAIVIGVCIGGYFLLAKKGSVVSGEKIPIENVVVSRTVTASGVVKSENYANLAFTATGKVIDMGVEEGQEVEKGETLANVYNFIDYQEAQSAKDARDVLIREKDLYMEQYGTNVDAASGEDEYYLRLRKYDEQISQAEATYQAYLGQVTQTYLKAPFNGTVVDVSKEIGEVATYGETVIKLADLNSLIFEVEVDQEDYGRVKVGQKAMITLDAYDWVEFIGEVVKLPLYADTTDDVGEDFAVKIAVTQDGENPILYGMNGDVDLLIESTNASVAALPFEAIYIDEDSNYYVWIADNQGKLRKQQIEIGLEGDLYTQVKSEITGDVVIPINEKNGFEEGKKVKIAE